jgi:hypothetical protein
VFQCYQDLNAFIPKGRLTRAFVSRPFGT